MYHSPHCRPVLWGYEDEGTHFWHWLLVPEGEYSPARTVFWVSPNSGSFLEGPTQKLAFVLPDSVFPGLGSVLLNVLKGSSTDSGSLGKGQQLGQTAEVQKACEERSWGRIHMAERHFESSYSVLGTEKAWRLPRPAIYSEPEGTPSFCSCLASGSAQARGRLRQACQQPAKCWRGPAEPICAFHVSFKRV